MAIPFEAHLRLVNDSRPAGKDRWEWSVWVEGDVDGVESVTYRLHPSFPQPVITVRDPAEGFRLRSSGWGEFTVAADLQLRSGRTQRLERWLELRDAQGEWHAPGRRPRVFIASSVADAPMVERIEERLGRHGIGVARDADLDPGAGSATLRQAIRQADGVVAVFSDATGSWVEREFDEALNLGRPTFPVILGDAATPEQAMQVTRFELRDDAALDALVDSIAARVRDEVVPDEAGAAAGGRPRSAPRK